MVYSSIEDNSVVLVMAEDDRKKVVDQITLISVLEKALAKEKDKLQKICSKKELQYFQSFWSNDDDMAADDYYKEKNVASFDIEDLVVEEVNNYHLKKISD